jgi:hypothetical protein
MRKHFADAWVTDYEPLIDRMNNHPKDRHVLAAAVKCGASLIRHVKQAGFSSQRDRTLGH